MGGWGCGDTVNLRSCFGLLRVGQVVGRIIVTFGSGSRSFFDLWTVMTHPIFCVAISFWLSTPHWLYKLSWVNFVLLDNLHVHSNTFLFLGHWEYEEPYFISIFDKVGFETQERPSKAFVTLNLTLMNFYLIFCNDRCFGAIQSSSTLASVKASSIYCNLLIICSQRSLKWLWDPISSLIFLNSFSCINTSLIYFKD